MQTWLDIETAPKDGTVFLAYEYGNQFACWAKEFTEGLFWMDYADSDPAPSHWMPLPSPPSD